MNWTSNATDGCRCSVEDFVDDVDDKARRGEEPPKGEEEKMVDNWDADEDEDRRERGPETDRLDWRAPDSRNDILRVRVRER